MGFIDVHCHLEIYNDFSGLLERAKDANITTIVTHGTSIKTNRLALKFAETDEIIRAALGIYPTEAVKLSDKEFEEEIDFISEKKDSIIAIGEVGLDLKELNELKMQRKRFEKFIILSKKLGLPLVVHSRNAEEECINILEKNYATKVIMHCFSGNLSLVERILKNGWHLSIPTSITYNRHFQKVAEIAPVDQILCETDSPFLSPVKGNENEPSNIVESYKKISEIKGMSLDSVERKIENNFKILSVSS